MANEATIDTFDDLSDEDKARLTEMAGNLTWPQVSALLSAAMLEKGEWSGCPVPLDGHSLTIESRNPYREKLQVYQPSQEEQQQVADCQARGEPVAEYVEHWGRGGVNDAEYIRNEFVCHRRRCHVTVVGEVQEPPDGNYRSPLEHRTRVYHIAVPLKRPAVQWIVQQVKTMDASVAWVLDAEIKATEKLHELITPRAAKSYWMMGCFLETSKRSNLTYLFRRNRPTLVLKATEQHTRILCALCLHPIGYYTGTWAGCMVPTDEVIAHLLLMRADEKLLWKRANQISPDLIEYWL